MIKMKNNFFNGKKGDMIIDTILVIIVLIAFAVTTVLGNQLLGDVNDQVQASDMANVSKEKLQTLSDNYTSNLDDLFIVVFLLFWIVIVISSFFIDSHPAFFIVALILIIALLFVAAVLGNAYETMSEDESFDNSGFPKMNFTLSNLLLMFLLMAASVGLAIYGKAQFGGGI